MSISIREKYRKEAAARMTEQFSLSNACEVPRIEKAVVNVGIGKHLKDANMVKDIVETLSAITGQKPVMTKSRKSIAGFKTREGLEIGVRVTLRGRRMWDFIDKLVNAAIPRIRDFHGVKKTSVDENGNFNLGIKEQLIFPEIMPEHVRNIFSLQVNISTSAHDKEKGLALFRILGFPIEKQ